MDLLEYWDKLYSTFAFTLRSGLPLGHRHGIGLGGEGCCECPSDADGRATGLQGFTNVKGEFRIFGSGPAEKALLLFFFCPDQGVTRETFTNRPGR
jgi:hypothetical protein